MELRSASLLHRRARGGQPLAGRRRAVRGPAGAHGADQEARGRTRHPALRALARAASRPRPAGMQLYQDARKLLSDASAMRERLQRAPDGLEGSVTLAVPFLLASLLLGPVLARLKQRHPRIRVFVLDDLSLMVRKAMVERRADIGILVDTRRLEGLDVKPFARERCSSAASTPTANCRHDGASPGSASPHRRQGGPRRAPVTNCPSPARPACRWCCSRGASASARRSRHAADLGWNSTSPRARLGARDPLAVPGRRGLHLHARMRAGRCAAGRRTLDLRARGAARTGKRTYTLATPRRAIPIRRPRR
jgi:DNA-binding transcriptional LysR family regulator